MQKDIMGDDIMLYRINHLTKEDSVFAHLTSSLDKGVEWVLKYGDDWSSEEYCFIAIPVTLDKDECFDDDDDAYFIDLKGNLLKENPLYSGR